MIMHFLYDTRTGRRLLKMLMNTGGLKLAAAFLKTRLSTEARTALHFHNRFEKSWNGEQEIRVRMGESIGNLW